MKGSEFKKLFTMFYGFFNTQYNLAYESIDRAPDRTAGENIGQAMKLFAAPIAIHALIHSGLPTDKEKMKEWALETMRYPFGYFPVIRDVLDSGLAAFIGVKGRGYQATPAQALGDSVYKAVQSVMSPRPTKLQKTEALARVGAFAAPYPQQINDWLFNAADIAAGNMKPKVGDIMSRRRKSERR